MIIPFHAKEYDLLLFKEDILFEDADTKTQSTIEVEQTIIEAFDGKIPLAVHMMNL